MEEKGGGILADEMGMGKSLSILSLVIKTLQTAHEWAEKAQMSEGSTPKSQDKYSRATLIVVSSARKLQFSCHLSSAIQNSKGPREIRLLTDFLSLDQRVVRRNRKVCAPS